MLEWPIEHPNKPASTRPDKIQMFAVLLLFFPALKLVMSGSGFFPLPIDWLARRQLRKLANWPASQSRSDQSDKCYLLFNRQPASWLEAARFRCRRDSTLRRIQYKSACLLSPSGRKLCRATACASLSQAIRQSITRLASIRLLDSLHPSCLRASPSRTFNLLSANFLPADERRPRAATINFVRRH